MIATRLLTINIFKHATSSLLRCLGALQAHSSLKQQLTPAAAVTISGCLHCSTQSSTPAQPNRDRTADASTSQCGFNEGFEALLPAWQQLGSRQYSVQVKQALTNPTMPQPLAVIMEQASVNTAVRPPPPPLEKRPMRFESRRAGVIAIKAGMMQDWDEYGVRIPLTVLWIDECMVVRYKHELRDDVTSLVLGCGAKRAKQLHPRQLGEFQAAGVPLQRKLWECQVTEDALLPVGTHIGAAHFKAGQYLDITGTSKGKGFAGVMKRWNFAGQGASHGNTKHHRAPGAIGGRTDPGKVWKGKKMPGHLGNERVTFKNIWLHKIDPARNLLYVRGQVPGPQGSFLYVRDAFRWKWAARQAAGLPFPAYLGDKLPEVEVAPRDGMDPYRVYREDLGYFEADWKGD
eukprot:GHRR01009409.1.p1 GENE.GHRR01009409.1~~GHRR01009409.1.p1  ORF type:complete len:402 (+),score=114.78 GHRR01009409.1:152-1357(+)